MIINTGLTDIVPITREQIQQYLDNAPFLSEQEAEMRLRGQYALSKKEEQEKHNP